MTKIYNEEDFAVPSDLDYTATLDLNVIKDKVPTFSTEKLCEMIACDRYFGCFRDMAIICMEELARRRAAGEVFDFESRIEELQKPLPKLEFGSMNLQDTLKRIISMRGKK